MPQPTIPTPDRNVRSRARWRFAQGALALATLSFGAVACSRSTPLSSLNAITSTAGLRVEPNVPYGTTERQTLDVYAPRDAVNAPVVVFIHGGSWTNGSKDEYRFVGESFARAGYVTVVISYRLVPSVLYPEYVRDAASAIRWVYGNAARYGGNPARIFVSGHSAGGFNAVEVVVNERWLREVRVPITSIAGVIGIAGPYSYDFRQFSSRVAFPREATPAEVMPSYHVRSDAPPHLLIVAERDQVVAPENAIRMEAALREAGVDVERVVIPGVDHYTVVGAISRRLTFLGPVRQAALRFIETHGAR